MPKQTQTHLEKVIPKIDITLADGKYRIKGTYGDCLHLTVYTEVHEYRLPGTNEMVTGRTPIKSYHMTYESVAQKIAEEEWEGITATTLDELTKAVLVHRKAIQALTRELRMQGFKRSGNAG